MSVYLGQEIEIPETEFLKPTKLMIMSVTREANGEITFDGIDREGFTVKGLRLKSGPFNGSDEARGV